MFQSSGNGGDPGVVAASFDEWYRSVPRYWWRQPERHSADPGDHRTSLLTQMTLRLIDGRPPGRALDLGAGEGADAIRLALLGYEVQAVEISKVAADKITAFARDAGARVGVEVADIREYEPEGTFDIVICNGVLHYIGDKQRVITMMQRATRENGLNVVSLWSTYTPVPDCHGKVPVHCDDEDGIVEWLYRDWITDFLYFDREKPERSHDGMPEHSHSHIKMISRKP